MTELINRILAFADGRALLVLRIGIGFTLIYAALAMIAAPQNWVGFVPDWIGGLISKELFLTVHAYGELLLGIGLVAGFWTRFLSLFAFLDFSAILVFYGIDEITFRDFGLAMAALALFLSSLPEKSNGK